MKTSKLKVHFLFLMLFGIVAGINLQAQNYQATASNSSIVVKGTSNVHDWDMKAAQFTVKAVIKENDEVLEIAELSLDVTSEQLKSGKGGMDKNAYKALKTDKNKSIRFNSTKPVTLSKSGDNYKAVVQGTMEIAGTKKATEVSFDIVKTASGYTLKGEKKINMPEYNVTPPTALMGTVKTGADVIIEYNVTLK